MRTDVVIEVLEIGELTADAVLHRGAPPADQSGSDVWPARSGVTETLPARN